MEQLSRSLQTERNALKQEVKELQDTINPPVESESPADEKSAETEQTKAASETPSESGAKEETPAE